MNDLFKIADFLSVAIVVVLVGFMATFLVDSRFAKEDIVRLRKVEIKVSVNNYGTYEDRISR